ncbi:MAG: sulfotransferase domain-containing protein [Pseudomonadota bacterium]
MIKPDFFIAGAPKCGTTSVANWLGQHPEVFMSPEKELHFFNTDAQVRRVQSLEDYATFFPKERGHYKAVGEASVWYLHSETAVRNIEVFSGGSAKYIVCLRDPVDMAYALHSEHVINGEETISNFAEAWAIRARKGAQQPDLPGFVEKKYFDYYEACTLGSQLQRMLRQLDRSRVHLVWLEDLSHDPVSTLSRIFDFLGVRDCAGELQLQAQNTSKLPVSPVASRLIAKAGHLKRRLGLRRGYGVLSWLKERNIVRRPRAALSADLRQQLEHEFAAEIDLLREYRTPK